MGPTTYEQAIEDLRGLVAQRERVEAWHRDLGVPWTVLAEGLGVRKQTAHEAWAAAVNRRLDAGPPTHPADRAAESALW
jgi:hypothetical protein